jgi:transcriptional regulator with XRE-family HTH domain
LTNKTTPERSGLDSNAAIGSEIRALRKARGMTLAELASRSEISLSHVSAIERGAVNPSLQKIKAIASALAVPTAWFFTHRTGTGPLECAHVVRAESRRNLNMVYGETAEVLGYRDWLLSSSVGGAFYMGLSEFPPIAVPPDPALVVHAGEHHMMVIEGELVLRLQSEEILLREGDSCAVPGNLPHRTLNRSGVVARAIWASAPVLLPANVKRHVQSPGGDRITRDGAQAPGTTQSGLDPQTQPMAAQERTAHNRKGVTT